VESAKTDIDGKPVHEACYASKVKSQNAAQRQHDGKAEGATSGTAIRPWKVVAEEVCREQDSRKFGSLISELNRALDEQGIGEIRKGPSKPDGK